MFFALLLVVILLVILGLSRHDKSRLIYAKFLYAGKSEIELVKKFVVCASGLMLKRWIGFRIFRRNAAA